jgi:hypothetical protein
LIISEIGVTKLVKPYEFAIVVLHYSAIFLKKGIEKEPIELAIKNHKAFAAACTGPSLFVSKAQAKQKLFYWPLTTTFTPKNHVLGFECISKKLAHGMVTIGNYIGLAEKVQFPVL